MASPLREEYCTIEKAAEILGVHRSQISRYIQRGYLHAERVGHQVFVYRPTLEAFEPPGQGRRDFQKIQN